MWAHFCKSEKCVIGVGGGQACNWCGKSDERGSMASINETDARLNSHEAVCALRYEQINARLKRLEGIIIKAFGVLTVGMAGVIWVSIVPHLGK